jgi:ApaG protein
VVTEVTSGIRVSVDTEYSGRYFRRNGSLYLFSYHVTIENLSNEEVQLLGRHWFIFDTGDGPSEVEGAGVIGKQPILKPGEVHHYQSGCHLRASIGAMKGIYHMVRTNDQTPFKVKIPTLQFFATPRLN